MRTAIISVSLVFATAAAAYAQGGKKKADLLPGQGIDWQGDWDEAVREATARNVPIMFTVHKDN